MRAVLTPPNGGSSPPIPAQPVADAPHRLDRAAAEGPVDLRAQVPDVGLDRALAWLEAALPGVTDELRPAQHLPRPAHEHLEQRELPPRQADRDVPAPRRARGDVEAEIARLEDRRGGERAAPDQRADPGRQLGRRDRGDEAV